METIDVTPTWEALLPVLVEVAANGTDAKGRKAAMDELKALARAMDKINAQNQITMKNTTKTGQIPANVGFSQTAGNIRTLTTAERKAQRLTLADMAKAGNGRIIICQIKP